MCLPHQSVTPFLRGTPLLRKILASTPAKEWEICILILYEYSALLHCEISSLLLIVQRAFILYRAVIEGSNPQHLLQPRMADFPLTLWVTLPVVERIHPKRNKFAMGVENKATGDSKPNGSPALVNKFYEKKSSVHGLGVLGPCDSQ